MEDYSKYTHSPAHLAVVLHDHAALRRIVMELPQLAKAGEVNNEAESLEAEARADAVTAVIDRRDVPGRETPLHLSVRLKDPISAEILMAAGADWSLQNENGWSALQEAVCTREEAIALIIARHYQPLAWAKWCRRFLRIIASASRIRDFYMEITFHFESSVIPFIGRIAPSATYRIWKRGSNFRADMTLAGFDGFKIQRSDQTFLFLGDGYSSEDGKMSLPPGSLVVLSHKEKEMTNALEGAGAQPIDAENNEYAPFFGRRKTWCFKYKEVLQPEDQIKEKGDYFNGWFVTCSNPRMYTKYKDRKFKYKEGVMWKQLLPTRIWDPGIVVASKEVTHYTFEFCHGGGTSSAETLRSRFFGGEGFVIGKGIEQTEASKCCRGFQIKIRSLGCVTRGRRRLSLWRVC